MSEIVGLGRQQETATSIGNNLAVNLKGDDVTNTNYPIHSDVIPCEKVSKIGDFLVVAV